MNKFSITMVIHSVTTPFTRIGYDNGLVRDAIRLALTRSGFKQIAINYCECSRDGYNCTYSATAYHNVGLYDAEEYSQFIYEIQLTLEDELDFNLDALDMQLSALDIISSY